MQVLTAANQLDNRYGMVAYLQVKTLIGIDCNVLTAIRMFMLFSQEGINLINCLC